jgi:hypothetical protein
MKKIGSFSSALGFIFLGTWMIIKINNPLLAKEFIKWWPLIIVTLGLEIFTHIIKGTGNERLKLSGFFIPILIVFLIINTANDFNIYSNNGIKVNLRNIFSKGNFDISFNGNSKSIDSLKTLEAFGDSLDLKCTNGDIKLEKSKDKNIYIEASIYVSNSNNIQKYDIPFLKTEHGYSVTIYDSFIKGIKATIFLPEGYNININGDNLQIKSTDSIVKSKVDINIDNGNVDLRGDIENSNIKLSNGNVYLKNKICKDISINLNNGIASVDTEDQNISLDTNLDWGRCEFNNEKKVNSGIKSSIGTGEGRVSVKLDNGTIKVYSKK